MRFFRWAAFLAAAPGLSVLLWACVGDDPGLPGSPQPDGGPPGNLDGAPWDSAETPSDASDAGDAGEDGPRCDPKKAFNEVERLAGISTADDEHGVWVSPDELTAYVAVTPAFGSASTIKKSTRASRAAAFSPPMTDPQLAAINSSGTTRSIPSLAANGLVFVFARNDGVFVSVRNALSDVFPAPGPARSRTAPIDKSDPFIASGGESLLLARDNGVNGYEVDDAKRDIVGNYGDGGYYDYAPAPNVTNVNHETAHDRRPIYGPDLLTLVFASNRPPASGDNMDLYIAERAGTGGVFTSPARLPEPISSPASDLPGSLSTDGCILYFTSKRPGGFGEHDVYIAKRPK